MLFREKIIGLMFMTFFAQSLNGQCSFCKEQTFPIHCAVEASDCALEDVIAMVNLGFDVNAIDAKRGDTPLHRLGYSYNHRQEKDRLLLQYLIEKGADPSILNTSGRNSVDLALKWNNLKLVDFYFENGYFPVVEVDHPYYQALKSENLKAIKRMNRYEKKRIWNSSVDIPFSLSYDNSQTKSIAIQSGILVMNDDDLFATFSKAILLGPVFELEELKRIGIEGRGFYQISILSGSLGIRHYFGKTTTTFIDPQIGLALGPYLSCGYSRRIIFNGDDSNFKNNNFYVRFTWPHTSLKIHRRKRSNYYEKTRR